MQAQRFIPTPLLSLTLEYQMEYIKEALSAQSEEIRELASVQQKMELHKAAIKALYQPESYSLAFRTLDLGDVCQSALRPHERQRGLGGTKLRVQLLWVRH